MAKIIIQAVCIVEGEPLDIMQYYQDSVEQLENAGGAYGTIEVRVVAVDGMDFSLPQLKRLFKDQT